MKTLFSLITQRLTAIWLLMLACASALAAEPAGFIPNQPAVWCRFDGNARNDGNSKVEWTLQNIAFQQSALYLNGIYRPPLKESSGKGFQAICKLEKITKDHFTVALRFKPDRGGEGRNVLMGGRALRWFGIQVGTSGRLELVFNNGRLAL